MTPEEINKRMPRLNVCGWGKYGGAWLLRWGMEQPTERHQAIMAAAGFVEHPHSSVLDRMWVSETAGRSRDELVAQLLSDLRAPWCWAKAETNLERGQRLHQSLEGTYLSSREERKEVLREELGEAIGATRGVPLTTAQMQEACQFLADRILDMQEARDGDPDAFAKTLEDNGKLKRQVDDLKLKMREERESLKHQNDVLKGDNLRLLDRVAHLEGYIEVLKLEAAPSAAAQAKSAQRGTAIYCQNDEEI